RPGVVTTTTHVLTRVSVGSLPTNFGRSTQIQSKRGECQVSRNAWSSEPRHVTSAAGAVRRKRRLSVRLPSGSGPPLGTPAAEVVFVDRLGSTLSERRRTSV